MTVGRPRWRSIAVALCGRGDEGTSALQGLCSACSETLAVSGTGIALMDSDGMQMSMGASDPKVERLEELEFTLGCGPGVEAFAGGMPVVEADLVHVPPTRWAVFAGPAVDAGVAAVFSFPLRIGAVRLGALTLYQDHPGALSDDVHTDAFVMADVVTRIILDIHVATPEEHLSAGGGFYAKAHQASGIISVHLGISVRDALARLRARAFALDRPIGDVAADVVSGCALFDE